MGKGKRFKLAAQCIFFIDKMEDGKPSAFTFTGGGYGHGVGMSQNGVKSLADAGKKYDDIITYFYRGTDLIYLSIVISWGGLR